VISVTPRTFAASRSPPARTASRFLTHASSRPGISTSYQTTNPRWISTNHMAIPATTLLCPVTPVLTRLLLWPQPVLPRACLSPTAHEWHGSYPGPLHPPAMHIPVLPRSISFLPEPNTTSPSPTHRAHAAGHGRRLCGKSAPYHPQARTRPCLRFPARALARPTPSARARGGRRVVLRSIRR
jgi:hypothetical protein